MSRTEAARAQGESGPATLGSIVDLNGVVEGMRPLLTRIAGSFIQLETILDPAGAWVTVGSDQVEQLLLTLVVRASDAMPLGGTLVVATRPSRLVGPHRHLHGVVPAGRWATLRVTDTGSPLDDPGLLPSADGSTVSGLTPAGGAELAKVAGLVERVGGHLVVEEGSESGTAVIAFLPLKEVGPTGSRVSEHTPAVLVVDGDPWMQTTTTHLLRRAGYGVLQADHAGGALDLLRGVTGSCIRVMLVDADLAGGGPGALIRAARRLKPDLRVILVGRTRAGSSDDLLTKPFTAEELLVAVARRLGAASRE